MPLKQTLTQLIIEMACKNFVWYRNTISKELQCAVYDFDIFPMHTFYIELLCVGVMHYIFLDIIKICYEAHESQTEIGDISRHSNIKRK